MADVKVQSGGEEAIVSFENCQGKGTNQKSSTTTDAVREIIAWKEYIPKKPKSLENAYMSDDKIQISPSSLIVFIETQIHSQRRNSHKEGWMTFCSSSSFPHSLHLRPPLKKPFHLCTGSCDNFV